MMELELKGTERLYRALDVLGGFPTQEFMRGLVDLTIAQARERFDTKEDPEGQAWKSWSAGYRAAGAPFHSKHTLLHLSGDMMNSIQAGAVTRDHATIEVPVPYAARQNEERQFLGFIDSDPQVEDYAVDFMVSRMGDA